MILKFCRAMPRVARSAPAFVATMPLTSQKQAQLIVKRPEYGFAKISKK